MNERTEFREKGQSLVLVAVAMVALVIFVAITVDVSSAYYNRRTAQNAADGAALAGVSRMATGINKKNARLDDDIKADMNDFAERNGIEDTEGDLADDLNDNVDGWYVDQAGNRLSGEPMVGEQYLDYIPDGAYGIEAITYITAPTYFGGIFGFDGYPLQARAVSLIKQACGADCLVPITTHKSLLPADDPGPEEPLECFNIWRENQNDVPTPGLYGWVNWTWQAEECGPDADPPRSCPEVDQGLNACDSGVLAANLSPAYCASGFVMVGDWMSSTSGVVNASDVLCQLLYYLGTHDEYCNLRESPQPVPFTIPVYEYTNMDDPDLAELCNPIPCLRMKDHDDVCSGGLHYKVAGFARMQLLGFQLSQGESETVNAGSDGTECVTEGVAPNNGNRITAAFLNWVDDIDTSNECYDPSGTLLSSPKLTE